MVPYANPSYTTTRDYIDEVVEPALAPYAAEQVFTPRDDVDFWEVCYKHRHQ